MIALRFSFAVLCFLVAAVPIHAAAAKCTTPTANALTECDWDASSKSCLPNPAELLSTEGQITTYTAKAIAAVAAQAIRCGKIRGAAACNKDPKCHYYAAGECYSGGCSINSAVSASLFSCPGSYIQKSTACFGASSKKACAALGYCKYLSVSGFSACLYAGKQVTPSDPSYYGCCEGAAFFKAYSSCNSQYCPPFYQLLGPNFVNLSKKCAKYKTAAACNRTPKLTFNPASYAKYLNVKLSPGPGKC